VPKERQPTFNEEPLIKDIMDEIEIDKIPATLITDGLPSYHEAFNRVLYKYKT
jgi:hypothetical protein